ncbi:rhodanese-like domain-containing protein [Agaribacterium haliotis]|uniref:rhodanese-like domain-containing protein n=1 Tax=Agaribacterium haliotis TaxID=2013869 RepID=UPI001303FC7A
MYKLIKPLALPLVACLVLTISSTSLAQDYLWVDVRSASEFSSGHLPTAINIEYSRIIEGVEQHNFNKNTELRLYCRSGRRAEIAKQKLISLGYNAENYGAYKKLLTQPNES